MNKIIVIVGPTGVGKTKLSISLAKKYHGEIVNADAMQVYKELDIGTAKITESEKESVPHYLFDIRNIKEEYSIYDYQKECRSIIDDILSRGKTPILVGGTGLYIKACLYDYKLTENPIKNDQLETKTLEELNKIYQELDPIGFSKIDTKNKRRVINAIRYYQINRKSISDNKTTNLLYDCFFIGLTTERKNLYHLIDKRVDKMLVDGLEEEVRSFYDQGIFTKPLLGGIGYKEFYRYFAGEISFDDAVSEIKRNSRRYAKRQYTFFRHQLPVHWFETNYDHFDQTVKMVSDYIES